MKFDTITYSKEEGVATLTLNRPETLNAWNDAMCREVETVIDEARTDDGLRVLVITGAGKAFSSGADVGVLKEHDRPTSEKPSIFEGRMGSVLRGGPSPNNIPLRILELPIPVIAAVNGVAAGFGCSITLACDMRIASENARFAMIFTKRGLVPDGGSSLLLPKLIGMARACELIFTGDTVSAHDAERIGLVSKVVPQAELLSTAADLAKRISRNPPWTIRLAKHLLQKGATEPSLAVQIRDETYLQAILTQSEDCKEAIRAFVEKREPVFKGR